MFTVRSNFAAPRRRFIAAACAGLLSAAATLAGATAASAQDYKGFIAVDVGMGNGVTNSDSKFRVLFSKPVTRQAVIIPSTPSVFGGSVGTPSPTFYVRYYNYAALALSVSPLDNTSRPLWTIGSGTNAGRAAVWNLTSNLAVQFGKEYGPLSGGWSIIDQQSGGDGKVRLLWRQTGTGKLALWRLNGATLAIEAGKYLPAAPAGYSLFPQIAVGASDNKARIVWTKKTGTLSEIKIWTIGTDLFTKESENQQKLADFTFKGFGVGADNKVRLGWLSNADPNTAALQTLPVAGADYVVESQKNHTLPSQVQSFGLVITKFRIAPTGIFLILLSGSTSGDYYAGVAPVSPDAQTGGTFALYGPY